MADGSLPAPERKHTTWVIQPLTNGEAAKRAGWHRYTEGGLDNVWLHGGVTYHDTPRGPGVAIEEWDELDRALAEWIVERKIFWRGDEIRFLRKWLKLSQRALADLLSCSPYQVRRWENEATEMPDPASRLLRLLVLREWDTNAGERAPAFFRTLHERAVAATCIKASLWHLSE